jgi:heptosyltransferase-1
MSRILLVKTSSLGDVVHNLPVVNDIVRALPGAVVDWVVEDAFADVPRLHVAVRRVIPVSIRRWRRAPFAAATRAAFRQFRAALRETRYDAVVDSQGLLKSAWITRLATGVRHGLDFSSSREPLQPFYDRTHAVPWTLHAVDRNRMLVGLALGYVHGPAIDYGILCRARSFDWLGDGRFCVLLHGTSARRKLWPEASWGALGQECVRRGVRCVLPWGSAEERERSARLAAHIDGAVVPPRLAVGDVAALLAGASVVVGVDTGLMHLAAALGVPVVGIFCATDPAATGIRADTAACNLGGVGRQPTPDEVREAVQRLERQ